MGRAGVSSGQSGGNCCLGPMRAVPYGKARTRNALVRSPTPTTTTLALGDRSVPAGPNPLEPRPRIATRSAVFCGFCNMLLLFTQSHPIIALMVRPRPALTKREKEILDIVYARGHATAAEVRSNMHDPPSDASVRTTLRVLVAKGHLRIEQVGPRYDYWPIVSPEAARRSELQ